MVVTLAMVAGRRPIVRPARINRAAKTANRGDPQLETSGALIQDPGLADPASVVLSNASPNAPALLMTNLVSATTTVGGIQLWVSPTGLVNELLITDASGGAAAPFLLPAGTSLHGLNLYQQALVLDPFAPNGVASTDGLRKRVAAR